MMKEMLRKIFRFLFSVLCRVELVGLENIPAEGGMLSTLNHLSFLDAPLTFAFMTRPDATAVVANKYSRFFLFRWLLNGIEVFWLDRENPEPGVMRELIRFMRGGGLIGIAPEGTRSQQGVLLRGKPGPAYLAGQARVQILPAAVTGTESVPRELLRLRRPRIRLVYGTPYALPSIDRKDRDASLQRNADEIMCQIAALLPESYRGFYAGFARVGEIEMIGKEDGETKK